MEGNMHGMIALKNRKGRKRKTGSRRPDGHLIETKPDFRTLAANNPDRRNLPEKLRLSEKAASQIGVLNLLKSLTDEQYEAGRRFAIITGAFRAAIQTPRGMSGHGRGYSCEPVGCLVDSKNCECERRIKRFNECVSALLGLGQAYYNVTYRTAISDWVCPPEHLNYLQVGLNGLAKHLGIDK